MSDTRPADLGKFEPLPPERLEELIRRGAEQARELDRAVESQFTLDAIARSMVLR